MKISARLDNRPGENRVTLQTNAAVHSLEIPPKAAGSGSSANGGELLFLALAACFCNDIYREAGKRGLQVDGVRVEVEGEFGAEGEPARWVAYRAVIDSPAAEADIQELIRHTDQVAEIHNTLRRGIPVLLREEP